MTEESTLVERLRHADPRVRRIAAMDLAARARSAECLRAVQTLLPGEADESAAVTLIRLLQAARFAPAWSTLDGLRNNQGTTVRVAHAATLAADEIELNSHTKK
ncbi:MAG: hypothetical protein JSR77_00565 [Planctomycetes bacterium]|nr:hypothetical protein [Planctomycetota bacterium]